MRLWLRRQPLHRNGILHQISVQSLGSEFEALHSVSSAAQLDRLAGGIRGLETYTQSTPRQVLRTPPKSGDSHALC